MTLRDFVLIVARSWIVVAVSVAVGLVASGIFAFTTVPTYTASADVLFSGHDSRGGQDQAYFNGYVQSRMQSYGELANSTSLLEAAAEAIGPKQSAADLDGRVTIEVSERNTVATISVVDSTAKGAADAANAVAEALVDAVGELEPDYAPMPPTGGEDDSTEATIQGVITHEAGVPSSSDASSPYLYLLAGALGGLAISIGVIAYREALGGDDPPSSSAEDR